MYFKFTDTGNTVFLQIFDSGSEVAACHLKISKEYTEILSSKKYQITEISEPVDVLDIQYPVDAEFIAPAHLLENINGKQIKIVESAGPNKHLTICTECDYYFPKSWLKQKPAEPTREELQERLDKIIEFLSIHPHSSNVSDIYLEAKEIANGEK